MNSIDIKTQCKNIYKEAFAEDTAFEERLFGEYFKYCKYIKEGSEVVSILFALPCNIVCQSRTYKSLYVFAAATAKRHRGKRYMTCLLELLKKESKELLFLRPATESLIGFYKGVGFTEFSAVNSNKGFPLVEPSKDLEFLAGEYAKADGSEFTLMYSYKESLDLEKLNFIYSME